MVKIYKYLGYTLFKVNDDKIISYKFNGKVRIDYVTDTRAVIGNLNYNGAIPCGEEEVLKEYKDCPFLDSSEKEIIDYLEEKYNFNIW